jgi:hypothetical protein
MRVNAIGEPMKYNKERGFNDTSEHNRKRNNNNENVPFSEVLKREHSVLKQR